MRLRQFESVEWHQITNNFKQYMSNLLSQVNRASNAVQSIGNHIILFVWCVTAILIAMTVALYAVGVSGIWVILSAGFSAIMAAWAFWATTIVNNIKSVAGQVRKI